MAVHRPPGHAYSSKVAKINVPTRPVGVSVVTAGSANGKEATYIIVKRPPRDLNLTSGT